MKLLLTLLIILTIGADCKRRGKPLFTDNEKESPDERALTWLEKIWPSKFKQVNLFVSSQYLLYI